MLFNGLKFYSCTDPFVSFQIGWGTTKSFGPTSDELMKVNLPVNGIGTCEYYLENEDLDSSRQICAGGEHGKVSLENKFALMSVIEIQILGHMPG